VVSLGISVSVLFLFIAFCVVFDFVDFAAAHDAQNIVGFFLLHRKQEFRHAFSAQEKGASERAEIVNRVAF
jgi:hypothetical protein